MGTKVISASNEFSGPQDDSGANGPISFSTHILNIGFLFALVLAAACFIFSALYLYRYLYSTNAAVDSLIHNSDVNPAILHVAISAKLATAKFSLLSCSIVAGLAFGFMGFALFLLGVRGNMDVRASTTSTGIQIARIAPGTFVMLCSVLLIGLSVTQKIDFAASADYVLAQDASKANFQYSAPEVGNDRKP